jgi:uncharacterized protein DUF1236
MLRDKHYDAPSTFAPESLLRAARRGNLCRARAFGPQAGASPEQQNFRRNIMRRTWTGAAVAALATAFVIPVAFAQETYQGQQAPANRESGQHRQTGQGMGKPAGQPGAQAQTERSQMGAEPGQGQNPRERGEAGKPGMKGAQTGEPNRMQPGNRAQAEERRAEPQGQRGEGAQAQERRGQAQERRGQAQNGARAAQPGRVGQNGAGQAPTGQAQTGQAQNRERMPQTGQAGRPMTGQNVQATGKANIPQAKAAQVAQTLMASGGAQSSPNININNVTVGAALPGDVIINPLPPTIVELVPQFSGYDYFVVGDEVVIVDPATRQVVEIIEAVG